MRNEKLVLRGAAVIALITVFYSCIQPDPAPVTAATEWFSGGTQTVFNKGVTAFSTAFPELTSGLLRTHDIGDNSFGSTFVSAPAPKNPGLGPIFNNVSCTSCHIGDGRGKPPAAGEQISSLLIRVSIPGTDLHGGPNPVPGFGVQLQQRAIYGVQPEADVKITYEEKQFQYADGSTYSLRFPTYILVNSYIPLPADVMISPRVAPPVFGLGLIEAIAEEDIVAKADEGDLNNDGISGKPNYVWSVVDQKKVLGRFGWKANNPTLLQQSAGAYNEDMGITNYIFPNESSYGQSQYSVAGKGYDVSDSLLSDVAFYIRTLAVPARRDANNSVVLSGKQIFTALQCAACHTPNQNTKTNVAFPELSNQSIYPYTDLLLHDMGTDLADNRPDFDANGQEWRTPPLWGIGLTQVVNGHNNFLHDGRARSLEEAILWHGGEAAAAKESFTKLSPTDRNALIKFLESL